MLILVEFRIHLVVTPGATVEATVGEKTSSHAVSLVLSEHSDVLKIGRFQLSESVSRILFHLTKVSKFAVFDVMEA